jgi:hypothetical protein
MQILKTLFFQILFLKEYFKIEAVGMYAKHFDVFFIIFLFFLLGTIAAAKTDGGSIFVPATTLDQSEFVGHAQFFKDPGSGPYPATYFTTTTSAL